MELFVGLGNIGREFENTFHNVGFLCIEKFAQKNGIEFNKKAKNSIYGIDKEKGIIVAKPTTFMNLSGSAISELMVKFKIKPEEVFVFYDDFDLPLGAFRYRPNGSAGTHNGARHITSQIGQNWHRFRVGIKPEGNVVLLDYVLSKIGQEAKEKIEVAVCSAVEEGCKFVG